MACKTCRLLSTLDSDDADYLNRALLTRRITAVDAKNLLDAHTETISITSVRDHRSAKHSVFKN